jgi:hypothetical protein
MADGRILYTRWEYVDRPAIPIQSFWTINPDGTRLAGVFGNRVLCPSTFMQARGIPAGRGRILCLLTGHGGPCHGAVGMVDPRVGSNAQQAITNLTPEVKIWTVTTDRSRGDIIRGPYTDPYPINHEYYPVSNLGSIELRDYRGALKETVVRVQPAKKHPATIGFFSPQPIRSRERERLVPSALAEAEPSAEAPLEWAELYMTDVCNGLGTSVRRGDVKQLAVVEDVGLDPNKRSDTFGAGVAVSAGATYAPKRVWGFAAVEADGSAHFKVPARRAIYFLPLDDNGMAVQRMRTFTHLMPGEVQGCVGCHADRNYAVHESARDRPTAMLRKAQELRRPDWGVRGFSYPALVQPVWDKHCLQCHGYSDPVGGLELSGDRTDFFSVSYDNLVRKGTISQHHYRYSSRSQARNNKFTSWIPTYNGCEANVLEIEPGRWGARASLLARTLQSGHPGPDGKFRIEVPEAEKLKVYLWLDLNVPYYHANAPGSRSTLPPGFARVVKDMAQRRCAACHEVGDYVRRRGGREQTLGGTLPFEFPDSWRIRIDHPERNPLLAAPLAKVAGGTGKCGEAVFKDTHDADYRRLIDLFEELHTRLDAHPRLDAVQCEELASVLSKEY